MDIEETPMKSWVKEFDVDELRLAANDLGLHRGAIVYLSGSVAALPQSEQLYQDILDCLIELVGSEGTIVMPTFSFDFCDKGLFDVNKSGTYCGKLSEAFLRHSRVCRTWASPIHSVAVTGKYANHLMSLRPMSGFGVGSVFDWLVSAPTTICLLGVSISNGVAHVHWLEEKFQISYRHYTTISGIVRVDGEATLFETSRFTRNSGVTPSADEVSSEFEKSSAIKSVVIGSVWIRTFSLASYISFMADKFQANRDLLIN